MRGVEVVAYIGHTAMELSGIGEVRREYGKIQRGEEEAHLGSAELTAGANGMFHLLFPFYFVALREDQYVQKRTTIVKYEREKLALPLTVGVAAFVGIEAALIARLGYNLLAEVAPDVARLAKSRILHK